MQQGENSIFVRNLDEKVTEELLYELFLQAGPLEEVRIPTVNGVSRNFGFVVFTHEESVPYAICLLDKTMLYGRSIFLKDARAKQENFPSRGPPRQHVKDRLGPHPAEDNSYLRAAPGFVGRRYKDHSMQPTRPSINIDKNEEELRHQNDWTKPGSLNLYPSQKGDQMKGHNSHHFLNGHVKHSSGGFFQSRKPYEKPSHQRENSRYDYKHFRRSK